MNVELTEQEWAKLDGFAGKIAADVVKALPADWPLEFDYVKSEVLEQMLKLLASYRKGPMSSTTWCWRYAEKRTLKKLRSEYRRLKNQDTLMALEDFDKRPMQGYDQKRTGAYAHIQRADEVE